MTLVLRSVFMDPVVDEFLRAKAFREGTSKNDLIRRYLVLGIKAVAEGAYPMIEETGEGAYAGAETAPAAPLDALVISRDNRNVPPDFWPVGGKNG